MLHCQFFVRVRRHLFIITFFVVVLNITTEIKWNINILNKIDNGLSNKLKRLSNMFTFKLALLFIVKLFLKSKFYAPMFSATLFSAVMGKNLPTIVSSCLKARCITFQCRLL